MPRAKCENSATIWYAYAYVQTLKTIADKITSTS